MAVSIRDIAREAGVTVGTVSRALNNYPDVSPTTRERIVETAQRLGDHPNQMARNLSSKHNHNIALVLSGFLEEELINDFDALLMKGCFHYTVNNDVEMSIQVINTKIQTEKSFEQLCYEHNIAGAILMGLRTNDPYCELLAKSKYPCVTIDIEVPGPNVSCVMMDDIKAFDELTQYLIDKTPQDRGGTWPQAGYGQYAAPCGCVPSYAAQWFGAAPRQHHLHQLRAGGSPRRCEGILPNPQPGQRHGVPLHERYAGHWHDRGAERTGL